MKFRTHLVLAAPLALALLLWGCVADGSLHPETIQTIEQIDDAIAVVASTDPATDPLPPNPLPGITGLVGTLVPGAAPWMDLVAAPLLSLLFKRPRKHILNGVKKAVEGDPKGAMLSIPRALGWAHSSEDPRELVRVARSKALESDQPNLAAHLGTVPKDSAN